MASKAIGSFHARASLDATDFDAGAHQMAAALNQAARDIDNAWGIIDNRAVKSARASASVFEKSGLGPVMPQVQDYGAERIQQAIESNRSLTAETYKVSNSARASAAVFAAAMEAEEEAMRSAARVAAETANLRIQQAAESNRSITQSQSLQQKSARDSAAVFIAAAEAEEEAQANKLKRMAETLAAYRRQGLVINKYAGVDMAQIVRANNEGALSMARLNKGQEAGSKAASRYGLIMQQVGYQVQDFSVQAAAGQNKLVAFSQQSSQLLGFFGPYGAIAGAAIATGVLAYRMSTIGEEVQSAKEKADALAKKMHETAQYAKDAADYFSRALNAHGEAASVNTSPQNENISQAEFEKRKAKEEALYSARMKAFRQSEALAETAKLRSTDERKTEEERNALALDYVRYQNDAAKWLSAAASDLEAINKLEKQRNETIKSETVAFLESAAAQKSELQQRIEAGNRLFLMEEKAREERKKEADVIRDQLDPMRARIREQERLNELVKKGALTSGERDSFNRARVDKTVLGLQSRIPQSLQMSTGASALGGTVGGGTANQIIDIQKGILDGIRQLVRMEMMAGAN